MAVSAAGWVGLVSPGDYVTFKFLPISRHDRILYGMSSVSQELMEKEERGEVVFGGCVIKVDGSQASWKCTTCGLELFKTAQL
jgi:hypothetical protein